MEKKISKTLNNVLLSIGTAHYLACTVQIVQTRNQPYIWTVLAIAGILSVVSGYVLIKAQNSDLYRGYTEIIPLALFGCCVILIPLILLLKGGF